MRKRHNFLAALGALSLSCSTAYAKPHAKVASDPRDAEIQALLSEVRALAAKVDTLQARIAAPPPAPPAAAPAPEPAAIIQTISPPASPPSSGYVTIADGKPMIRSVDGRFTANLHIVMQFDAAAYQQATPRLITSDFRRGAAPTDTSHARNLLSGTNFRRARIGFDGKAFGDWDYSFLLDYGGAGEEDAAHIQELWVQYSALKPFHLKIGAFSPSIGLEDQGSTSGQLFLERSASADIARNLAGGDFRDASELWANGSWWYVNAAVTGRLVGVINSQGSGAAQPYGSQLGVIGRVGFLPVKTANGMIEVGVHGSYVARPADFGGPDTAAGTTRYSFTMQERPELRVDGTRLISTGVISAQHASTAGLEAAAQYGGFFIQSEYEQFRIERRNGPASLSNPNFDGYYLEGSYTLAGEKRRFNANNWAFDAPGVSHPFSLADHTWGAWEIAGRYSDIDLNYHAGALGSTPVADAVRGGEQKVWSAGLNWYPNTVVRFLLDFQDVRIERLSPSASSFATPNGAEVGQHYHAISVRSQFAF